jgi:hypothetical protein
MQSGLLLIVAWRCPSQGRPCMQSAICEIISRWNDQDKENKYSLLEVLESEMKATAGKKQIPGLSNVTVCWEPVEKEPVQSRNFFSQVQCMDYI